jgi:tetratricopeptide (TPR) repeat protein
MAETGRELHGKAETAREIEGNFLKALELTDQATIAYSKENDLLGLAEVQASRFIIFKHLFQSTGDEAYLILGRNAALSGVEIARLSGIKEALALPLFNLGKAYFEMKDWKNAVKAYQEAADNIESNPPKEHDRPAVKLDIKGHLYTAEYLNGDKSALERAIETAEELKNTDEISQYNKDVWLSGAYLRIAVMQKYSQNADLAQEYLEKARQVIESNEELKLRKGQLEKVEELITS